MNDTTERLVDLCARVRQVVLPALGAHAARDVAGTAVGGDVTFGIDQLAEDLLVGHMRDALPTWAFYSEDGGLQGATDPELILIVDPIDGTRPAAAGFEMACVSVAAVPASAAPTMGDVVAGVVQEIKSGDLFVAEKGAGFSMTRASSDAIPFLPTERTDLESLFWTLGFRGRPAVILASVLEELIDASSVGGSVFDIGSATYSVTRILTGQLDAYVDIGPAIIDAHPWVAAEFRRVGRGNVLCNSPYDLAAVHLLCTEAGVPIGDAAGRPLDDRPVLGSDSTYQLACIVSGNQELQQSLIEVVQRGIRDLRDLRLP
ncbi:MAG TPA: inositol monophosphatase family protein [Thermoleophilia bacterium]